MPLIGASPITFISEDPTNNHGTQYQVPLSLLTYDPDPVKFANSWSGTASLASADQTLLQNLLQSLYAQGLLKQPS